MVLVLVLLLAGAFAELLGDYLTLVVLMLVMALEEEGRVVV